jgi:hypothetical protein
MKYLTCVRYLQLYEYGVVAGLRSGMTWWGGIWQADTRMKPLLH